MELKEPPYSDESLQRVKAKGKKTGGGGKERGRRKGNERKLRAGVIVRSEAHAGGASVKRTSTRECFRRDSSAGEEPGRGRKSSIGPSENKKSQRTHLAKQKKVKSRPKYRRVTIPLSRIRTIRSGQWVSNKSPGIMGEKRGCRPRELSGENVGTNTLTLSVKKKTRKGTGATTRRTFNRGWLMVGGEP